MLSRTAQGKTEPDLRGARLGLGLHSSLDLVLSRTGHGEAWRSFGTALVWTWCCPGQSETLLAVADSTGWDFVLSWTVGDTPCCRGQY